MLKLTRKQELRLIDIGLQSIIDNYFGKASATGKKWTPAQKAKFKATMKAKYGKKFAK